MTDGQSIFAQRATYFDGLIYLSDQELKTKYQKDISEATPDTMSRGQIIDALIQKKFGPSDVVPGPGELKVWDVLNKEIYHEVGQKVIATLYDNISAICKKLTPDEVRYLYSALDTYNDETFRILQQFARAGKSEVEVPTLSTYRGWNE